MRLEAAGDLEALAPQWREVWAETPDQTPFQRPEWLLPWWRHVGAGPSTRLRCFAAFEGGDLTALLPLFVWAGPGGDQLTLLGNGVSDMNGAPARSPAALAALAGEALAGREAVDWRDLPGGSPLLDPALAAGAAEPDAPRLVLDWGAAAPESVLSPKLRANLRRTRRRAERQGGLRARLAHADSFERDFEALRGFAARRFAGEGGAGALQSPTGAVFLREAARGFLAAGLLRLWMIEIGGTIAAALLAFAGSARPMGYACGFDPAFAQASPGALAIEAAILGAHAEGATGFDFLRGDEPYKALWRAEPRAQFRRLRARAA